MSRSGYNYYQNLRALRTILVLCCLVGLWQLYSWLEKISFDGLLDLYLTYRWPIAICIFIPILIYLLLQTILFRKTEEGSGYENAHGDMNDSPSMDQNSPDNTFVSSQSKNFLYSQSAYSKEIQYFINIEPFGFEFVVAELLRFSGYRVIETGGAKADGGIDLLVEKLPTSLPIGVQIKKYYREHITVANIREFLGAMAVAGFDRGIYVTLKGFTKPAIELASEQKITLIDANALFTIATEHQPELNPEIAILLKSKQPFCTSCYQGIIVKRARKGRTPGSLFWACKDVHCRHTKKLSQSA